MAAWQEQSPGRNVMALVESIRQNPRALFVAANCMVCAARASETLAIAGSLNSVLTRLLGKTAAPDWGITIMLCKIALLLPVCLCLMDLMVRRPLVIMSAPCMSMGAAITTVVLSTGLPGYAAALGVAILLVPFSIGVGIGALCGGLFLDYIGRKRAILLGLRRALGRYYRLRVCVQRLDVAVGRCIINVAVGTGHIAVTTYMAEVAPSAHQGRMVSSEDLLANAGVMIAYFAGLWVNVSRGVWRYIFGLGALWPAVCLGLFMVGKLHLWMARGSREYSLSRCWLVLAAKPTASHFLGVGVRCSWASGPLPPASACGGSGAYLAGRLRWSPDRAAHAWGMSALRLRILRTAALPRSSWPSS
jgi:MFS family permease